MAKKSSTKVRIVELLKILHERTDEEHRITLAQIAMLLEERGIPCERKALYDDMAALKACGVDVRMTRRGGLSDYYLATRALPTRDLSLLIDCVQSSSFLTDELSDEVCADLLRLASIHGRDALRGQVEVPSRTHMANAEVFGNVASIREAIATRRKVTFRYFTYGVDKEREYHAYKGGRRSLTPVRLVYADDVYYLVLWEPWYDTFAYYRVDRMSDIEVTDEPAERNSRIASYSVAEDESVAFGLFIAEKVTVSLLLEPYFINALIDKFGLGVSTYPQPDGRVKAFVGVCLSPAFFGWVFAMKGDCMILGPVHVLERYREFVAAAMTMAGMDGSEEG